MERTHGERTGKVEAMAMNAERRDAGPDRSEAGLWSEHGDVIGRVCMALLDGNAPDARAAVEATFGEALSKEAPASGARAWLCAIARAECARLVELRTPAAPTMTSGEVDTPHARARRLLAEVKPTERDAVVLWKVGGLSLAEVAHACGIDEPTARARVNRGLARLRASTGDE